MQDHLVDVVLFLQEITKQSGANQILLQNFIEFIQKVLITNFQAQGKFMSPQQRKQYNKFYGLGTFLPKNTQEIKKYSYLDVFADLKFLELFEKILST